jgi:DNA polymerase
MIIVDTETKSDVDLKACGDWKYVHGKEFDVLVMCWHDLYTEESGTWHPGDPLPDWAHHAHQLGAFNARFDRLVWDHAMTAKHGWPEVPLENWYCVAAQMRVNNLPGQLDKAGRVLFKHRVKRASGHSLIQTMCIPPFKWTPSLQFEMDKYCRQDVIATVDVHKATRPMTAREQRDWQVNELINDRGVAVDIELAEYATGYAEEEQAFLAEEIAEVTNGIITKTTQTQRIRKWVMDKTNEEVHKHMVVYKDGEKKYSLDKNARQRIMEADLEIPGHVRDVIEILDEGSASSVSKFKSMINRADEGLVKGAFIYAGATPTNRYVSRGLQLHNMKRDCFTESEADCLLADMQNGYKLKNVMQTLSKLLRPAIVGDLVVGDWSAIEARVLPWAANTSGAIRRLDYIRAADADPDMPDLYTKTMADLNLGDRQEGKVAELSLGYCGGKGAFAAMARNYGLNLPTRKVENIIDRWRNYNSWAIDFGDRLEHAAKAALRLPGQSTQAGRISFCYYTSDLGGTLVCTLPSGDVMQYHAPRLEQVEKPWGMVEQITAIKANWTPKTGEKEWPRIGLWRGLLSENVTQGIAAALLRESLVKCEDAGLPVVAHVHDEIVVDCELYEPGINAAKAQLQSIMETPPEWATDLPLVAKPSYMGRYGK